MSDSTHPGSGTSALAEFRKQKVNLTEKTIARLMESKAEFQHFGDQAADIMHAGFGFLNRMLETVLEFDETAILEHQLDWSANRLPHDGVPLSMLLNNIRVYQQVIEEDLTPASSRVIGHRLDWMINRLEELSQNTDAKE